MRAPRKGHAATFNLTRNSRDKAHTIERAVDIGDSVLTEAIALVIES